jgi:hypothetical protein
MKFLASWSDPGAKKPMASFYVDETHFKSFRGYTDKEIKDILSLGVKETWRYSQKDPVCNHNIRRIR